MKQLQSAHFFEPRCDDRLPTRRGIRRLHPLLLMWISTYTHTVTAWVELADLIHPGDSIRERRIELGWTQAELSRRADVPQADISRIENGRLDARWSTIQRLSAALAHRENPPRRSLANGRKVSTPSSNGGARWTPRSETLKIS
jgi:DNA-binding XRE family transcriptional regulator